MYPEVVTVIERLRASGLGEAQAQSAAVAIAKALPVERSVCVDDAIRSAARQGDTALLVSLLADEVEPEDDEMAALAELEADSGGETLPHSSTSRGPNRAAAKPAKDKPSGAKTSAPRLMHAVTREIADSSTRDCMTVEKTTLKYAPRNPKNIAAVAISRTGAANAAVVLSAV